MFPRPTGSVPSHAQPFKATSVSEFCDRIKDDFGFLQAQNHSLKLECEKLVNEKTEMQRQYVMYYEMSYGLNIEMHKQSEIAKRLNALCGQIIPYLAQEHQQQVISAVERAKQVTMQELNQIVGQLQMQNQLAHSAAAGIHPGNLQIPQHAAALAAAVSGSLLSPNPIFPGGSIPSSSAPNAASLLALSQSGLPSSHSLHMLRMRKPEDNRGPDQLAKWMDRDRERALPSNPQQNRSSPTATTEKRTMSDTRTSTTTPPKKQKSDTKNGSEGEQSDQNVVVDDLSDDDNPKSPSANSATQNEENSDPERKSSSENVVSSSTHPSTTAACTSSTSTSPINSAPNYTNGPRNGKPSLPKRPTPLLQGTANGPDMKPSSPRRRQGPSPTSTKAPRLSTSPGTTPTKTEPSNDSLFFVILILLLAGMRLLVFKDKSVTKCPCS